MVSARRGMFDVDRASLFRPRPTYSLDAPSEEADDRAQEHFDNLVLSPDRVRVFDVSTRRFPFAVEVRARDFVIDGAPLSTTRIALGWDNASTFETAPQDLASGKRAFLTVNSRRGTMLEVWADSPVGSRAGIEDVRIVELDEADRIQQAEGAPKDPNDPLGLKDAGIGKLGVGLALLAVLGLVIYVGGIFRQ